MSVLEDLESFVWELDRLEGLLSLAVAHLRENAINPSSVLLDANAIQYCTMLLERTADDLRELEKRAAE